MPSARKNNKTKREKRKRRVKVEDSDPDFVPHDQTSESSSDGSVSEESLIESKVKVQQPSPGCCKIIEPIVKLEKPDIEDQNGKAQRRSSKETTEKKAHSSGGRGKKRKDHNVMIQNPSPAKKTKVKKEPSEEVEVAKPPPDGIATDLAIAEVEEKLSTNPNPEERTAIVVNLMSKLIRNGVITVAPLFQLRIQTIMNIITKKGKGTAEVKDEKVALSSKPLTKGNKSTREKVVALTEMKLENITPKTSKNEKKGEEETNETWTNGPPFYSDQAIKEIVFENFDEIYAQRDERLPIPQLFTKEVDDADEGALRSLSYRGKIRIAMRQIAGLENEDDIFEQEHYDTCLEFLRDLLKNENEKDRVWTIDENICLLYAENTETITICVFGKKNDVTKRAVCSTPGCYNYLTTNILGSGIALCRQHRGEEIYFATGSFVIAEPQNQKPKAEDVIRTRYAATTYEYLPRDPTLDRIFHFSRLRKGATTSTLYKKNKARAEGVKAFKMAVKKNPKEMKIDRYCISMRKEEASFVHVVLQVTDFTKTVAQSLDYRRLGNEKYFIPSFGFQNIIKWLRHEGINVRIESSSVALSRPDGIVGDMFTGLGEPGYAQVFVRYLQDLEIIDEHHTDKSPGNPPYFNKFGDVNDYLEEMDDQAEETKLIVFRVQRKIRASVRTCFSLARYFGNGFNLVPLYGTVNFNQLNPAWKAQDLEFVNIQMFKYVFHAVHGQSIRFD